MKNENIKLLVQLEELLKQLDKWLEELIVKNGTTEL